MGKALSEGVERDSYLGLLHFTLKALPLWKGVRPLHALQRGHALPFSLPFSVKAYERFHCRKGKL